jgi:hypothetical protein
MQNHDTDRRRFGLLVAVLGLIAGAFPLAQSPAQPDPRGILQLELACAPRATFVPPSTSLQVAGSLEDRKKSLFGPGDTLVVNAGADQGLKRGQEFYVRRIVTDKDQALVNGLRPVSIHTAGWIRLLEIQADRSTAAIVHACDGLEPGDFLESFTLPEVPTPRAAAGEPDYAGARQIMFGAERRTIGGETNLMVIEGGADRGLQPGEPMTIFRTTLGGGGPVVTLGSATVMLVDRQTAVIRIDRATDIVYAGDQVAQHRHAK